MRFKYIYLFHFNVINYHLIDKIHKIHLKNIYYTNFQLIMSTKGIFTPFNGFLVLKIEPLSSSHDTLVARDFFKC